MVLRVDGEVVGSATAVEVLGDPLRSVVFMANKLGEIGLSLKAGMVLLTGSIIASVETTAVCKYGKGIISRAHKSSAFDETLRKRSSNAPHIA